MKEKIMKQEKGITLIALVVTIVVLLILAGVAISSLAGENGILKRTKEAKIQTTRGQIQEILDLAVIEGTMLKKSEDELFNFAIGELKEKGYTVINKIDNSTTEVNKIELSESKVQIKENESKTITVIIDETSYTNRYYAKVEKQYFEITVDNDRIEIAENETDIDNITPGEEKQIEVAGASYSTVAINQATKEITITGGENLGTDTLTVKYGGKQAVCEVEVGSYITSLVLTTADGTKITNGMQLELNKGDGLIITATTNSDAKEQISWTNSNTSVTPMTVSEDKKTVNLTGSAVGTSTITATTAKIKISFTVKVVVEDNTLVSKIKPENYGDVITGYTGYTANEVSEWKIFLNDGNNVWIMASDYVEVDDDTLKKAGMTNSGGFTESCTWWSSAPSNGEPYANGNCAKALSNTENWTKYVNINLATKAMGGPTLEMFANSYNAKYPSGTNGIIDITNKDTDYNGYKVRWKKTGEEGYSTSIGELENDGFYYLSSRDKANAYWLASPAASWYEYVMKLNFTGGISGYYFNVGGLRGVRPVVCLKSDIQVKSTTSEDITTWTIQ